MYQTLKQIFIMFCVLIVSPRVYAAGAVLPIQLQCKKTICPVGQYVYKCGNYRVGFNWLKGMTKTLTDATSDSCASAGGIWEDSTCTITTGNYYISDDTTELFDQMRKFFAGEEKSIKYCDSNNCDGVTDEYISDRDTILKNVCDLSDSSIVITCATCPNSATVPASTSTSTRCGNKMFQLAEGLESDFVIKNDNTWISFNTIADCYMNKFTDYTGTYIYVESDTDQTAKECYYVNTNSDALSDLQGDSIENFTVGGNSTTTLQIAIPTSSHTRIKSLKVYNQ